MTLLERVRAAGVVGAGGAGFPTHVKLASRAEWVIANGAECEPLLHKDAAVMEHFADRVVAGVRRTMEAVGAGQGVVAIKAKNARAVAAMESACAGSVVRVERLGDYYPAGDEFDLVHTITGKLIPAGGLPLHVGCLVNNVETLAQVAAAAEGTPVTRKTITVAGAVRTPVTLTVPLGTPYRDCIRAAGGARAESSVLFLGGLMMGEPTEDWDTPVVKTGTGVVVLPADHRLVRRRRTPSREREAIGKSACDQCRYCTEFCPRYLLGYAVEPHQVMRGLAFTATGAERWNEWASLCCACGLCTVYACPEDLFPKEACDDARSELRRRGFRWNGPTPTQPHPLRDGRRVPIRRLMQKLEVEPYDDPAPWRPRPELAPARVVLPWKQSAGVAAVPTVAVGDRVEEGQCVGEVPEGALGARLHASISGVVEEVTGHRLTIRRTE